MKSVLAPMFVIIYPLAGCAGSPHAERAPDLSGNWKFEVQAGRNVVHGAMSLTVRGQGYVGTLTTDQGSNALPVRSLTP